MIPCAILSTLGITCQWYNAVQICGYSAQIQSLRQDVDKRDFQLATLKDQQNESQKREENLRRQVDRLTYDNNSLQADLTASRDELDEARQNANVCLPQANCLYPTLTVSKYVRDKHVIADQLTYDNNSLQANLTASQDELDEARQNANVC